MDADIPPDRQPVSPVRPFLDDGDAPTAPAFERAGDEPASRVRPYQLTGGRAGPSDAELEIEAQVVATEVGLAGLDHQLYESHAIIALCVKPIAVAEVAVRLNLHVGVARVLVGDLVGTGDLSIRRPDTGLHRNASILERVIRGLESIR